MGGSFLQEESGGGAAAVGVEGVGQTLIEVALIQTPVGQP